MNFKIFGDRVLLREPQKEEDQEIGGIFVPESAQRKYVCLEVVTVGDGRVRLIDGPVTRKMDDIKPGDRVFLQLNPMMMANNMQKVNDVKYLTLNYHDIIARIDSGVLGLTLDTLHPVGRWVFVSVETPEKVGVIYLPGSDKPLQSAGEIKLRLAKAGKIASDELGVEAGTRLMVEHSRVSPMHIDRKQFAYLDVSYVCGSFESD